MRVKLKQAFDLQMGKTPARNVADYWNGCYSWVSIADLGNISNKYIVSTREKITDRGIVDSKIKIVPKGTVIMSFKLSIGKTAITSEDMYTNEAIIAFHNRGIYDIDTEYLYYFCCGTDWGIGTNKAVMGLTLNKKTLSEREIEIPDIALQRKNVAKLNKIDAIINRRKQQLQELDQLVKSRFVELFGDMFLNSMAWDEQPLDSMADIVSGITKGRKTKEHQMTEVPYMAVSNVKDGYIDWTTVKTIEATEQEINQYRLLPDDVLMTEGGDPDKLGRGAIIKEPLENCIHQNHIFRVRLNGAVILPVFFEEYLKHQKSKRYFLGCAKQTTGIASINMRQLKALPVLLPPLQLQKQFAAFVKQVDKSKYCSQKFEELCHELIKIYEQEWI